jgi:3-deoxy-manno-octulosonate cytidylyltransferase (CMP-KDO synthetase)
VHCAKTIEGDAMKIVGIIPARMSSGRYPGKPMASILGMPMVGHCFHRSKLSRLMDEIYVATPDREVFDYVESIGGKAIMTSDRHEMCTDRVVEAAMKVEQESGHRLDIIVNIQGDQPMVFPDMIDDVTRPLIDDPALLCSTMVDEIVSLEEFVDPNRIKVVMDCEGNALYFSREPIPSREKCKTAFPKYKHVALIPFRRDFLIEFGRLSMTPLETVESVDYLRAVENGYRIKVIITKRKTETVDTPEDLRVVEKLMADDPLLPSYFGKAVPR